MFFFFSSRRRHTRFDCDWSSDVCSSDLVRPDGAVENLKFIEGGHNGVTLHAPKGLALLGDTLWVADIDVVRAFDARTGAPRDSVSLATLGAVFLNDIAIAQTGALYITDSGIKFDDVGNVLHP